MWPGISTLWALIGLACLQLLGASEALQPTDYLHLSLKNVVMQRAIGGKTFVLCKLRTDDQGKAVMQPDDKLHWYFPDGRRVEQDKKNTVHVEYNSAVCPQCPSLMFYSVSKANAGEYKCKGTFKGTQDETSFTLQPFKSITFDEAPKIQNFSEYTDAKVMCAVSGEPPPNVEWKRDRVKLGTGTGDKKYIITENSLIIRNISRSKDTGIYACQAKILASDRSEFKIRNIKVQVYYRPSFDVAEQESVYSWLGGKVNLTCKADGLPEPGLHWFSIAEEGSESSSSHKIHNKDEGYNIIDTGFGTSSLQITVDNVTRFGEYMCRAKNNLGKAQQSVILRQAFPPDHVPAIETEVLASHTIEVIVHAPVTLGPLDVTGYIIKVKAETPADWSFAHTYNIRKGKLPLKARNLKPNTLHHIRVWAYNDAGVSEVFAEGSVRTLVSGVTRAGYGGGANTYTLTRTAAALLALLTMLLMGCLHRT